MSSWWKLSIEESLAKLGTDSAAGLTSDEARRRLAEHGPNELRASERTSPWELLLAQFKNVLIVLLLIATALSIVLGHEVEAIAIVVIVVFAVLLGFAQEYRAERAIEALRTMAAPTASVLRGGREIEIAARELVPGDLILLRAGDRIPADARIVEAANLQTDEAALTGESLPVDKTSAALELEEPPVGDRANIAFAGTAVTYGRGTALVVSTGMDTEFGKVAGMLESVRSTRTPLQENLDRVGRVLAVAALVIVLLIVGLGLLRGQPLIEMVIFGIALAVAVVPEALPAVVTISLAIGVQRMVHRNALMRRLPAVETLGTASVICTDKTGTLTKDEMTVRRLFVAGEEWEVTGAGYEPAGELRRRGAASPPSAAVVACARAALLCSDARLVPPGEGTAERWTIKGDPTEGALVVAAAKAGLDRARVNEELPREHEIPFASERKRMTTLHRGPDGLLACSKGAPEVILASCSFRATDSGAAPLDAGARAAILDAARRMAGEALRVLAIASKANAALESAERDMVFLGLAGMIDPPRPEARAAVDVCRSAGIGVMMITGDHPVTAQAIAAELGITSRGRVVTGAELEAMSDGELEREVGTIDVCARVSPAHKLRVVTALQRRGQVVAMTGDGVNDAPALKKADIGIAMGITGTDVSKEAAAMTLTDDNFASIVAAVEEGRGIFSNIKKYLMYLLSSNLGEIGLMGVATLAGLPLPLTAVQILFVNLFTDGLPALALAVDPPDRDLMSRRPRDPRAGIFTPAVVWLMVAGGLWSTIVNVGLFVWSIGTGRGYQEAMTMTFMSLVIIQFFKAYNFRSDRRTVLDQPFANRWLNWSILGELAVMLVIVYLPVLHAPFGTFSLSLVDWAIVVVLAFSVSPVLEAVKWIERRQMSKSPPS